jgi:hypothetical protein
MLLVLLLPSGRVLGRGARRRCLARRGRPLLLLGRDSSSGRGLLCPELGGRRSFSGGRLFGVGLLLDRGLLGELLLAGFAGLALLAGDLLTGLLLLGLALALLNLLPGGLGAVTLLLLFALLLAGFALGAGLLFPAGRIIVESVSQPGAEGGRASNLLLLLLAGELEFTLALFGLALALLLFFAGGLVGARLALRLALDALLFAALGTLFLLGRLFGLGGLGLSLDGGLLARLLLVLGEFLQAVA